MEMITVEQAEKIILSETKNFGTETISYDLALGRILAENLVADRDLPPFNRPTVDGIAIEFSGFEKGIRSFKIKAVQSAGEKPIAINSENDCIEIMTGASIDDSLDTVIRYEDVSIENGIATINIDIKKGQNIHLKGKDKRLGEILVEANQLITPAIVGIAASIGKTSLLVKKLPKIVIISTGDELIEPEQVPEPFQLRRSNGMTIKSVLEKFKLNADLLHLNDDYEEIKTEINRCIEDYDVILLSGGVSMGKFDFLPKVFEELKIKKLFHKIKQRPGKPFWFGKSENEKLIFAFPGNPVSVFMCLHRYFIPWLEKSLGIEPSPKYAILENDIEFLPSMQYFSQVKLNFNKLGQLTAKTVNTNGSGDFSHLAETNAFIELLSEKTIFKKGEVYRIWTYNF